MTISCVECGASFEKRNNRHKYCGPCRKITQSNQARKWAIEHRQQRNKSALVWYHQNPAKALGAVLKRKYGLTFDEYEALRGMQNGRCALCGKTPEERNARGERLAVDHDHVTGRVRGLLCTPCNTALGLIGDDVATLRRTIAYLENS